MKYISILIICFVMVQCSSTNQTKPYVEATEREFSFDHIDGLPKGKDLKALVNSPGFNLPQIIGGKEMVHLLNFRCLMRLFSSKNKGMPNYWRPDG